MMWRHLRFSPSMNPCMVYGGGGFSSSPSLLFTAPRRRCLNHQLYAPHSSSSTFGMKKAYSGALFDTPSSPCTLRTSHPMLLHRLHRCYSSKSSLDDRLTSATKKIVMQLDKKHRVSRKKGASQNRIHQITELKSKKRQKAQEARERRGGEKLRVSSWETPRSLSAATGIGVVELLKELIHMGYRPRTADDRLTKDYIDLVCESHHFIPVYKDVGSSEEMMLSAAKKRKSQRSSGKHSKSRDSIGARPPIVCVMGHVNHGKTTLLDALRSRSSSTTGDMHVGVAQGEAGGITQKIGGFRVTRGGDQGGESITFFDTPGHAAFSHMRSRGAAVTDAVVLVVAADEGVKQQTTEALQTTLDANVPIIVAITKTDKKNADVPLVERQLARHGLELESIGGDVQCVHVSATTGEGLDDLLDSILLQSEDFNLSVPINGHAEGVVIDVNRSRQSSLMASVLVTQGVLAISNPFLCGHSYGKVRQLRDEMGRNIPSCGPGTPITLMGFRGGDAMPRLGDKLVVMDELDEARTISEARRAEAKMESSQLISTPTPSTADDEPSDTKELTYPLLVKADSAGSLEAVVSMLEEFDDDRVDVNVLRKGVGVASSADVEFAADTNSTILMFNTGEAPNALQETSNRLNVAMAHSQVIYDLISHVRDGASKLLPMEDKLEWVGTANVLKRFEYSSRGKGSQVIAGCVVNKGKVLSNTKLKVIRGGEEIFLGSIQSLQHGKKSIGKAPKGSECGICINSFSDVREGDVIECFTASSVPGQIRLPAHLEYGLRSSSSAK